MYNKNIIAIILILLGVSMIWKFALPFKEKAVDSVKLELTTLKTALETYTDQTNLQKLENKVKSLNEIETNLLETYVPKELHSGKITYTLSQIASQNRLNIKNIQYSLIENPNEKIENNKKLSIEFQFDGYYENFNSFLAQIEKSDILIDVESIKANRINNNSDILNLNVKLAVYGVKIE